ncbi:DUF3900 domain-containing protein [Cohnella faecalis]|uniref:DUF3900 domain-containing protein n=1 Tax=Cohnella faecalis TaxID=2315694 RepID=A0A398CR36_9BACL|nr:DUF3900 domain-containing protein [Cohnella faecalis]RIE01891.1 DUF3900 domain-containing protein [Cohnella faecalis]
MKFTVQYLSFFVIHTDQSDSNASKKYKHYQTLTHEEYQDSEIKAFLDDEFTRIGKRKVEVNPISASVPTKVGRFIVEPGHDLTSNPNFNLFQRLRTAQDRQQFHHFGDDLLRTYMDASAVRGGAFIVALARHEKLFDDPFVFMLKCDFESSIARISDERSLISKVEMAISSRNIKSIQYPHMPEEGMLEEWELKVHQASHARYFEDFLKYVSYEKSKPEIVSDQVMEMVHEFIETKWEAVDTSNLPMERREYEDWAAAEKRDIEVWAASEKRELQQKWSHDQVVEAATRIVEHQPELEMKFKLDEVAVRGPLSEYGGKLHIARLNGRYVVLIEGDHFQFDRGVSPIELLHPEDFEQVVERIRLNAEAGEQTGEQAGGYGSYGGGRGSDEAPW